MESEYVDYELFLDEGFSAVGFANSLVQATNNVSDVEVDLDTPAKRLGYDLEEVDRIINETAGADHGQLLEQAANVRLAEESLEPMRRNLEQVNFSYAKLENDVLRPYDRAQGVFTALKRLHLTSSLLRALTWYLYLARQLSGVGSNASADELYNAALTLRRVRRQVAVNPGLKSLHIIRTHERMLQDVETSVRNQAQGKIKFFSLLYDVVSLAPACLALYLLDPDALAGAVNNFVRNQVAASAGQLAKALGAPIPAFERAAHDARDRARVLGTLLGALDRAPPSPDEDEDEVKEEKEQGTLLEDVKRRLDLRNVLATYWRDLASSLDGRIREFVMRSPSQARSMAHYMDHLKEVLTNTITDSDPGISSTGPEVKVMINAITAIAK